MPCLLGAGENEEDRNGVLEASRYKYSKGAVSPGWHQCDVSKSSGDQDRRWQEKGCQCYSCDKRGDLSAHDTPVIETKTFTRFGSRANPKRDEADAASVSVLLSACAHENRPGKCDWLPTILEEAKKTPSELG